MDLRPGRVGGGFMIECDNWSQCGVRGGGCCAAGHYGGRPSLGVCGQCPNRLVQGTPVALSIEQTASVGFTSRAGAYLAAEAKQAIQGPASDADAAARLAICLACPDRADTLEGATDPAGGFCTKCGCGGRPRAALSVKTRLAGSSCPLGKWGQVQGTGATPAAVADAMAGVLSTVADQAKRLLGKKPE